MTCEVSDSAYSRGYGSPEEIMLLQQLPNGFWR